MSCFVACYAGKRGGLMQSEVVSRSNGLGSHVMDQHPIAGCKNTPSRSSDKFRPKGPFGP